MELNHFEKVGRNNPCPCGSGYKYKKCCLLKDEERSHAIATFDPEKARRGMESTLKKIAQIAEQKDMTVEDLNRLFVGKNFEKIDEEYASVAGNSPKRRAEDLLEQAYEETSCVQMVKLAKQALEIYPHLPDAWIMIGEHSSGSPEKILPYFEKALEAGMKDLGEKFFKENKGHFWGMVESRPFMRAKAFLAQALWDLGRNDEAIVHYQECLELNPNDNQGLRDELVCWLMIRDRVKEAEEVLKRYKNDAGALHAFNKALCLFRLHGVESKKASKQLVSAIVENPHVPKLLMGKKKMPAEAPDRYALGSVEEAFVYVEEASAAWKKTPGALDWLSHFA